MLEAWRFCKGSDVVEMLPSLRGPSDEAKSGARRDRGERLVRANRVATELRVRDDERGSGARRERAVHRDERIVELLLPIA